MVEIIILKLLGGIYDGNHAGQDPYGSSGSGNIIHLQNADYTHIDGVYFTGARDWGIRLYTCEHFTIENCFADDGGADDVYAIKYSSKHGIIRNCISYNHTNRKGVPLTSDFELENGIEDVVVDSCKCFGGVNEAGINVEGTVIANKDITVSNCIVENKTDWGFTAFGTSGGAKSERITFSNCIAKNTSGGEGWGFNILAVKHLNIVNCHMEGNGGRGMYLLRSELINVIGSTFKGNGSEGLGLYETQDVIISGLRFENNTEEGIYIYLSDPISERIVISGSQFNNNTKDGIRINSGNYTTITGCSFYNNTLRGITEEGTADYTLLDGCTFSSNGSGSHNVNAVNSVMGDIVE